MLFKIFETWKGKKSYYSKNTYIVPQLQLQELNFNFSENTSIFVMFLPCQCIRSEKERKMIMAAEGILIGKLRDVLHYGTW